MKRAAVLFLIYISIISLSGCSNTAGNMVTSDVDEVTIQESDNKDDSVEITEKEEVEKDTEIKVDKQIVISNYEASKQDFGAYYYIWDSPQFDIPLLLITDNCVDEDEEFFKPGTAYSCKVYCADLENNNIEIIGEIEAPSTSYPLAEDEGGLYVAFHHFVYQYIPDYTAKELVVWNGFEDDVVNNLKEHSEFLEIKEGIVKEVESVDMNAAYDSYNSANVIVFAKTADESLKTDQYYHLSREYDPEGIMENCTISLMEDGRYRNYEGNLGDIIECYKEKDLNGDGKPDEITRIKGKGDSGEGYYYMITFSDGATLKTKVFSAWFNEGETIEYRDINNDGISEILFTHYTGSTGGPLAWDVYLYYCDKSGEWKFVTLVDNNNKLTEALDVCNFKSLDIGGPTVVGVEIVDEGVAMLFDHGYKDGPDQTFDFDAVTLDFDNGSLSVIDHSKEMVDKYWPVLAE